MSRMFALAVLLSAVVVGAAPHMPVRSTAPWPAVDSDSGGDNDWRGELPDLYPSCDATSTPRCDVVNGEERLITCEGGREMSQPFYSEWVGGLECDQVGPFTTPQQLSCDGDGGWILINGAQASNVAACVETRRGRRTRCTPLDAPTGIVRCM